MYSVFATTVALFSTVAFVVVFIKAGYLEKIFVKYGLKRQNTRMNWTAFSWESCLRKLHCKADVVFFGDSLVRGGDFHKHFPEKKIVNLGCSGDTLSGMIGRISTVQAMSPQKVFLMGGINGLTDQNVACCLSAYEDLVLELGKAIPTMQLYIHSVLPISAEKSRKLCKNKTIEAFNAGIRNIADRYGHIYVDLHSLYVHDGAMAPEMTVDGVHLKPESYEIWYQAIRPHI